MMSTTNDRPVAVGIDLGTTYSAVAYIDNTGRPVTLVNAEGDLVTPSVVLFEGDQTVVGKEALKAGLKKIVLRNTGGLYVPSESIKYEAGVLSIDHGLLNIEDIASRASYLTELMEKSL